MPPPLRRRPRTPRTTPPPGRGARPAWVTQPVLVQQMWSRRPCGKAREAGASRASARRVVLRLARLRTLALSITPANDPISFSRATPSPAASHILSAMGARWRQARGLAVRPHLPPPADVLLAGCLFLAFEFTDGNNRYNPIQAPTASHVLWALVGAVMTLSLAVRRNHPLAAWVITSAGAALLLAFVSHLDPFANIPGVASSPLVILPAPLVALYTLTSRTQARGRFALVGSVIGLALLMFGPVPGWRPVHVYELGPPGGLTPDHYENPALLALVALGAFITAWALGETVRARRESSGVRRAAAEAEKAEHDRAVAAEERARIAREIHD